MSLELWYKEDPVFALIHSSPIQFQRMNSQRSQESRTLKFDEVGSCAAAKTVSSVHCGPVWKEMKGNGILRNGMQNTPPPC